MCMAMVTPHLSIDLLFAYRRAPLPRGVGLFYAPFATFFKILSKPLVNSRSLCYNKR